MVDLFFLQRLKEEEPYIGTLGRATIYYLAPEVLSGQGYGFEADYWSLGVLVYLMATGSYPYGHGISQQDPSLPAAMLKQINSRRGLELPKSMPA